MKEFLARAKAFWLGLPKWQKFLAVTVLMWAIIWFSVGTVAALVFGVGAASGFCDGVLYQAAQPPT